MDCNTDLANYTYLCREMTALVGTGTFCNPVLAVPDARPSSAALFDVFPNPARHTLTVQLGPAMPHNAELRLFDGLGRVTYSRQNLQPASTSAIDVSTFPRGIYRALVKSGTAVFGKTILLE